MLIRSANQQSKDPLCARVVVGSARDSMFVPVESFTVFVPDKRIWWEAPNSIRIPTAIAVALVLGLRIYGVCRTSKNTRRSPKTQRIERIIAISLWSFIGIGVAIMLLFKR
jgi:hypothetical protein